MQNLELAVANIDESVDLLKPSIFEYISDTNVPLDERWAFYEKCPDYLLEHEFWFHTFEKYENKYGNIDWYDDFYKDRYATVYLRDIVNWMLESADYVSDDSDELTPESKEKIDLFKEEVLESGLASFIYDW